MTTYINHAEQYHHACVRDLCWALASPPLMLPQQAQCCWYDDSWYRELSRQSRQWLERVDRQPDELLAMLEKNPDRRLGSYFETLWAFYFQHSPRYSLLARNLQIFDRQRTLGELDFVVRDEQTGRNLHIEVAVKFYLGLADTTKQQNWHGPGGKDRLDIKMQSLLERQSVFSQRTDVREQLLSHGIEIDDCAVIMKGRLFYPADTQQLAPSGSHPNHLRSQWWRYSDFEWQSGLQYMPLLRSGWMAGQNWQAEQGLHNRVELDRLLAGNVLRLPLLLLAFEDGRESHRCFIVPDNWTNGS